MPRLTSTGTCQLCERTLSKQAMSRHLAKCLAEKGAAKRGGGKRRPPRLFHLFIDGGGPYWLHVEVLASITLEMLDGFLRAIWLECCGHLSAFQIGGQRYSVQPIREDWIKERDMHVSLGKVLEAGMKFSYEYDFGTTTELQLKVVGERAGAVLDHKPIQLLARNQAPAIACYGCGAPATQVNGTEPWEETAWLCDACAEKVPEVEEFLLPVVNSPRTGVCGYTGEPAGSF